MDTKSIAKKIGLGATTALNTPAKRLTLMVGVAATCAVTAIAGGPIRTNSYRTTSNCNNGDYAESFQNGYQYCCPGSSPGMYFSGYAQGGTCYYNS